MMLSYRESVELLQSSGKFYINPGLERIIRLLNLTGNPQNAFKTIHIAGTNGKGSVCAILSNILKCSGYRTGLYTSPHLSEYTERIKINNVDISEDEFALYVSKILEISEKNNIDLTEFEILTAAAFKYFADKKVDIAVIETGLGGRLDATNVCDNCILSVITSVSLDHTDRLGSTINEIAFEKAGIIKNKVPVIVNSDNLGFEVISKAAKERNSQLINTDNNIELCFENGVNYVIKSGHKFEFSLLGLYQKKNIELVFNAINFLNTKGYNILESYLEEALKTVKWPARIEYIRDKNMVIDGAHNPDAAFELKKSLDYYFKGQKRKFIYSTLNTKDYVSVARVLFNRDDEIYFLEFNHKNAVTFNQYSSNVNFLNNLKKINYSDIDKIINTADLKVVTGSLYMIGEIYKSLI